MLVPASSLQRSIWLAEQLEPDAYGYAMPLVWRVTGAQLDPQGLRQSIAAVIEKHEILRTAFIERDGHLWQQIGDPWLPRIEFVDFQHLPAEQRETAWRSWVREISWRPYYLESGHLLRVGVANLGDSEEILVLCTHHLVCDGPSIALLLNDVSASYCGRILQPATVQYRDFVAMQADELASALGRRSLDFWVERLRGAPSELHFPACGGPCGAGAVSVPLSVYSREHLRQLRVRRGVSSFMLMAATLAGVLHRWTGMDDVTFGCPVANRSSAISAEVVGPCTNVVTLRSRCHLRTTLDDLLISAREQVIGALENEGIPFEAVIEALNPPRRLGHTPYSDVMLNFPTLPGIRRLGDSFLEYLPTPLLDTETKCAMTATASANGNEPWAVFSYRPERISEKEICAAANDFAFLLDRIIDAPADFLSVGDGNTRGVC